VGVHMGVQAGLVCTCWRQLWEPLRASGQAPCTPLLGQVVEGTLHPGQHSATPCRLFHPLLSPSLTD
jgi:hypothetical protein